jgi:hypothetical protein
VRIARRSRVTGAGPPSPDRARGPQDILAALGPFFAVSLHRPGTPPEPPWRPLRELADQPEPLLARIGLVRAALASRAGRPMDQVELRIAASITHLGLTARLIAPAVAASASQHRLDLPLSELWWRDELGPVPLSIPEPADPPSRAHRGRMEPAGHYRLLDEVIAPITAATSALVPISDRVLWGNVASAINGAASQVAAQLPALSRAALAAAASLAGHPRLARERQPPGPAFRRSSCCLLYRLTPGQPQAVCADCILAGNAAVPSRDARRWRAATEPRPG